MAWTKFKLRVRGVNFKSQGIILFRISLLWKMFFFHSLDVVDRLAEIPCNPAMQDNGMTESLCVLPLPG